MINAQMREYKYYTYGDKNTYGQPQLSEEPQGVINMTINIISQNISNNPVYANCSYIGLTTDDEVSNKYVIEFNKERLKVEYVNPMGRHKQVFMSRM